MEILSCYSASVLPIKYYFLATNRTGSTPNPKRQVDISEITRCLLKNGPASGIQLLQDDLHLSPIEFV